MKFGLQNWIRKHSSKALLPCLLLNPFSPCFCAFPFPQEVETHEKQKIDLETYTQDFVLETKRVEIPGFPHAFNPGIVEWKGLLLMSFRVIPDRKHSFNSEIGLVFLDKEFRAITEPQLIQLRDEYSISPSRAEDARLIVVADRLFMVYDDNAELKINKGGFRVYIAEIVYDGEHFIPHSIECLKDFEGASKDVREKAWTPFIHDHTLLLAYTLDPQKIFLPLLNGSGMCQTIAHTNPPIPFWKWGIIRGGTPAYKEKDFYLGFFHSSAPIATIHSDNKKILHYFIGAYTFSLEPPFELKAVSPEPIVGKNFYSGIKYKPYWKPVCSVFPCGYVSDEQFIWLAFGRDDHEIWVTKLDKPKLLESLVPVEG